MNLNCKVEITAELVTDVQYSARKLQVHYHSTNLLSGHFMLEPNRPVTCRPHELKVDENILQALNEYGVLFTVNTHINSFDLAIDQAVTEAQIKSERGSRAQLRKEEEKEMVLEYDMMPHLSKEKKTAAPFQFQLDFNKLKLLQSGTHYQKQRYYRPKAARAVINVSRNRDGAVEHLQEPKAKETLEKQFEVSDSSDDEESRPASASGPAPHHFANPEWHIEHDYEELYVPAEQLLKPFHEKMMMFSKTNAVSSNYKWLTESKEKPIFTRNKLYKKIHIPVIEPAKRSDVIDFEKGNKDTSDLAKHYKKKNLKVEFDTAQDWNSISDQGLMLGKDGKFRIPAINTDFLYKRNRETYRQTKGLGHIVDIPDTMTTVLNSDKFIFSWSTLLLGQTHATKMFNFKKSLGKLKISIRILGNWLNLDTIQRLKPVLVDIKTVDNLPNEPIEQRQLSKKCKPVFTVVKCLDTTIPCYSEQSLKRSAKIPFNTGKILFLGLLSKNLRETLTNAQLTIEVHDRDPRRHIDDSTEKLFGDEDDIEYPHGVATFEMRQLLNPGTIHKLNSPITPSRNSDYSVAQGKYIESAAMLNIELVTPFPYFQQFKLGQVSLLNRIKYQKLIVHGLNANMNGFLGHINSLKGLCGATIVDPEYTVVMIESNTDQITQLVSFCKRIHVVNFIYQENLETDFKDWKEPMLLVELKVGVDEFITNVKLHIKNQASFECLQLLSHLQLIKEACSSNQIISWSPVSQFMHQVKHIRFLELLDLIATVSVQKVNLYKSQLFGSMFLDQKLVKA